MQPTTRNLLIALFIIGGFLVIHHLVIHQLAATPSARKAPDSQLPDFAAINSVKKRKRAFFDYLRPMVKKENLRLAELRNALAGMPDQELKELADLYGLSPDSDNLQDRLKKRVDQIPESLVLAQAAIESAWGTSRFARRGNNLFGQWCFTEGCGLVPKARASEASHEVRTFDTAQGSIRSYMHNLNSHRAYNKVRSQRTAQRQRNEPLSGCYLSEGLESYSEKGIKYVDMVKSMIRINKLEKNKTYCAPRMIAKPEKKADKDPVKTTKSATAPEKKAVKEAMQEADKADKKVPDSAAQQPADTPNAQTAEADAA